jgi:hypothetical protein
MVQKLKRDEAKPCPFCGKQPEYRLYPTIDDKFTHIISCENPKCKAAPSIGTLNKIDALQIWNKRY